jgi:hypothetical protein
MDRRWAFLRTSPRLMAPVISLRDEPRGARHWAHLVAPQTSHEGRARQHSAARPRVISLAHSSSGQRQLLFLFPLSNAY